MTSWKCPTVHCGMWRAGLVSPVEVYEGRVVQGKLSQAVRTEREENLLGLHDSAVGYLIPVQQTSKTGDKEYLGSSPLSTAKVLGSHQIIHYTLCKMCWSQSAITPRGWLPVRVPAGRGLLLVIFHVNAAQLACTREVGEALLVKADWPLLSAIQSTSWPTSMALLPRSSADLSLISLLTWASVGSFSLCEDRDLPRPTPSTLRGTKMRMWKMFSKWFFTFWQRSCTRLNHFSVIFGISFWQKPRRFWSSHQHFHCDTFNIFLTTTSWIWPVSRR